MQPDSVAQLSLEERKKIAKMANRSVASGVAAILCAGGCFIALLLFWFAMPWLITLSTYIQLSYLVTWLAVAFGISALVALIYARWIGIKVAQAKELDASISYAQQQKRREEVNAKLTTMKHEGVSK